MTDNEVPIPTLDYASPPPPPMPADVKAVAWVFIGFGVLAGVEIVWALFEGRLSINLLVLGIFAGRGILRLSPGWRSFGMTALVLLIVLTAVGMALAIANGLWLMVVMMAGFIGLAVWQFIVLARPEVRILFHRRNRH